MITQSKFLRCALVALLLLVTAAAFAQNRAGKVVTGVVYDGDTDVPLEAVVCKTDHSGVHAVTGADGRFSIPVTKADKILLFSMLGYMDSSIPASGTDVVVRLYEDKMFLDEIVVVGYGTQKI